MNARTNPDYQKSTAPTNVGAVLFIGFDFAL